MAPGNELVFNLKWGHDKQCPREKESVEEMAFDFCPLKLGHVKI